MASFAELKQKLDDYYPLYINGQWVDGENGERMDVFCPANNEVLTTTAVATKSDVDRAVQAAKDAFPAWRDTPLSKRYEILMGIHQRIAANVQQLGLAEGLDIGMNVKTAQYLVMNGAAQYPYFAGLIRTREDGTNSEAPGQRTMVVREPVGVVGAICAWNVPFLLSSWKLAPALAAGNCLVIKPSSYTPVSLMELVKVIADLLPPGVLNVVNGKGSTTGQYILDHPGIDKLSFTGSTEVGKSVGLAAAERIIPATLELGGKSAGIYFADIAQEDIPKAIGYAVQQAVFNSGQVCAMQSRVLVEEPIYDMFVQHVCGALQKVKLGMPWEEDAQMGPLSYKGHMESVLEYIDIGKKEGARVACGGVRVTDGDLGKGNFVAPTILADVDNSMRVAQEEIFGPVLSIIKFNGEEEAISIANDTQYGLSGGVYSGDLRKALRVASAVRTGTMIINGAGGRTLGGAAFGGFKSSGIGRECYVTTLDHFSQLKTIAFNY